MSVSQASKHELLAAQRARYQQASRAAKGQILDELVAATGYHRKHALLLFRHGPPTPCTTHGLRGGEQGVAAHYGAPAPSNGPAAAMTAPPAWW